MRSALHTPILGAHLLDGHGLLSLISQSVQLALSRSMFLQQESFHLKVRLEDASAIS